MMAPRPLSCVEPLSPPQLAEYLHVLGLSAADVAGPSADTLHRVVLAHACALPFEQLSLVLEQPVRLDTPSLYTKFVERRRGAKWP